MRRVSYPLDGKVARHLAPNYAGKRKGSPCVWVCVCVCVDESLEASNDTAKGSGLAVWMQVTGLAGWSRGLWNEMRQSSPELSVLDARLCLFLCDVIDFIPSTEQLSGAWLSDTREKKDWVNSISLLLTHFTHSWFSRHWGRLFSRQAQTHQCSLHG